MDEQLKEQADKRVKEGWIRASFMIEVLAVNEETAKTALENHIKFLDKEKKTLLYKTDYKGIKKVENPRPDIKEGYSNIVELELVVEDLDKLLFLVMNYGPSATEILEPNHITIDMGEAQNILNSVADLIHKFAQQGVGGIIIRG